MDLLGFLFSSHCWRLLSRCVGSRPFGLTRNADNGAHQAQDPSGSRAAWLSGRGRLKSSLVLQILGPFCPDVLVVALLLTDFWAFGASFVSGRYWPQVPTGPKPVRTRSNRSHVPLSSEMAQLWRPQNRLEFIPVGSCHTSVVGYPCLGLGSHKNKHGYPNN